MSDQRTLVPREPVSLAGQLRGVKVLLVEDELDVLAVTEALMRSTGAEVATAASAEAAVVALRTFKPDVIVSDIGMPGCNGYHLMRMVRSRSPTEGGYTPAIALTGFTRAEDHARALLAGYQAHLAKPITPVRLIEAISSVIVRP